MKYKNILFFFTLFVLFSACHNKNAFDFSQLENVDCQGQWGLPLVNAEYSIGDVLSMIDAPSFVHIGENGNIDIRYNYELDSVISASEYLNALFNEDFHVSGNKSFNIGNIPPVELNNTIDLFRDTLEFEIPDDKFIINTATVKSGLLTINLNYNISSTVAISLTCQQLTSVDGQQFVLEESSQNGQFSKTIDLGGYSLNLSSDNELSFFVHVYCPAGLTLSNEIAFNYELSLTNLKFSRIGGSFAPISLDFDEDFDFDISFVNKYVSGTVTLLDPEITCEIFNSFPVSGAVTLNEAALHGAGITSSIISSSPANIIIPANTLQFTDVDLPLASSLLLSPKFDNFSVSGTAVINPDGINNQILITEDHIISIKIGVVLPVRFETDNVAFRDTLSFPSMEISDYKAFSNLVLRLGISNNLPINFNLQAYFFDSHNNTILDSLFSNPQPVYSSLFDNSYETALFAKYDDIAQVQKILACDKIIVKAALNTGNQPAQVNANQKLGLRLSAKFDLDVNELVQLF